MTVLKQVLAIIPARGGSKAIPRKNIVDLGGKPLIAWTIEASKGARSLTRTIVSTDSPEIADVVRQHGAEVPFMRPAELATDLTPGNAPVFHALQWLGEHESYRPDLVVLLQPTSPMRTATDIDAALHLFYDSATDAVVGVTTVDHHPFWMKTVDANGRLHDFVTQENVTLTRQELPPVYRINGAIYASRVDALYAAGGWYTPRTAAYVMPFERSLDIDTPWDFTLAEILMRGPRDSA